MEGRFFMNTIATVKVRVEGPYVMETQPAIRTLMENSSVTLFQCVLSNVFQYTIFFSLCKASGCTGYILLGAVYQPSILSSCINCKLYNYHTHYDIRKLHHRPRTLQKTAHFSQNPFIGGSNLVLGDIKNWPSRRTLFINIIVKGSPATSKLHNPVMPTTPHLVCTVTELLLHKRWP